MEPRGVEPRSQDFQSSAYTKSAKVPIFEEAKGFEPLRRFTAFQFSGLAQSTKLCQTSMIAENNGLEPLRRFAGLTR